jgi:hypothetical protein
MQAEVSTPIATSDADLKSGNAAPISTLAFLFHIVTLFDSQRKELIMKSHNQPHPSGQEGAHRGSKPGATPSMSERQTQAYLMARDTIRRIQRTAWFVDAIAKDPDRWSRTTDGRHISH